MGPEPGRTAEEAFVRMQRLSSAGIEKLDIQNLGEAETLLSKSRHLVEATSQPLKRGIVPKEEGWGGWLGRYRAAILKASIERNQPPEHDPAPKRERKRQRDRSVGQVRSFGPTSTRSDFEDLGRGSLPITTKQTQHSINFASKLFQSRHQSAVPTIGPELCPLSSAHRDRVLNFGDESISSTGPSLNVGRVFGVIAKRVAYIQNVALQDLGLNEIIRPKSL
jgi:hypothetical protein